MKQIFFLLLLTTTLKISFCSVSNVIGDIIANHFVKKSLEFDFVTCSDSLVESDLIEKVFKLSQNVYIVSEVKRNPSQLDKSAIIFCESIETFKTFNQNLSLINRSPKPLNLLVHIPNFTAESLKTFPKNYSTILRFQTFITETKHHFQLIGFQWYTDKLCGMRQIVALNTFSKFLRTWTSENFFVGNFRNFYACQLSLGTLKGAQPASDAYQPSKLNISLHFWGYNIEILEVLSHNLNFKINYTAVNVQDIGDLYDNFDYMVFSYGFSLIYENPYYITDIYTAIDWIILVPPGEYYTPFEKLLLPFSNETWICCVVLHIVAVVVIFILKFMSKRARDFVFGFNVTTPNLNLLIAFTGGGQMVLPGRNFARFILMMYIIFSLIIRTAYQGLSFELLVNDPQKNPVESIQEMIEKNMSLYYKGESAQMLIEKMDLFPK
jgi:hypothetical protein